MRKLLLILLLFSWGFISASSPAATNPRCCKGFANGPIAAFCHYCCGNLQRVKQVVKLAADQSGNFIVDAAAGSTLSVSYTGYEARKVTVGDSTNITILLKSNTYLSEVVVIAYGKEKRKDLTSAVTSISAQQISEAPSTNLATALASRAPGLEVHSTSTQPGASASVNVRGLNSITQLEGPLYIVDGVALVGDIRNINPADIESVEILKDAAAAGIYGSRGC